MILATLNQFNEEAAVQNINVHVKWQFIIKINLKMINYVQNVSMSNK